jgi:hypothetical protein
MKRNARPGAREIGERFARIPAKADAYGVAVLLGDIDCERADRRKVRANVVVEVVDH